MTKDEIEQVVAATLRFAKDHWVTTGTAIRVEDAPMVTKDVIMHLGLLGLLQEPGTDAH